MQHLLCVRVSMAGLFKAPTAGDLGRRLGLMARGSKAKEGRQ
jgi:hypothetical protein